ncbi:MAG TPA: PAS domain S-box protein [Bryobacteraceae bacterium]|jgi:PAS domain S-box-containing protein
MGGDGRPKSDEPVEDPPGNRGDEAFPDAESRFRTIFESAGVAISVVAANGVIVDCNPAMVRLLGYRKDDLCRRMHFRDITHPDDVEPSESWFADIVAGRLSRYQIEKRYYRRDGQLVWGDLTVSAVRHPSGRPSFVIGIIEDITERKRAADALQESREHLEASVRASNTGLFEWNLKTNEVYYSPEWKSQLGYEESQISNRLEEWQSRLHPEARLRTIARVLAFVKAPVPNYEMECRMLHKDGTYRWILCRASVLPDVDGRPHRMLGATVDITERKLTEERLREYEKVVEGLPEMLLVVDREYRYLIANRAFLRFRALDREQVIGHRIPEILDKDIFERIVKPKLDECFKGRVVNFELRFTNPATDERHISATYLPIEGPLGVSGAACVLEDITERKLAEMELAIAHQQLTTELLERTRAEKSVRALSDRLIAAQEEERRSIARELHDDLSQEIAALSISVSNMKRKLPENSAELRDLVDSVHQRISRLADSVRNMARQLHPAVLEYSGIAAALQALGSEFTEVNGIHVTVTSQGDLSGIPAPIGLCLYRVAQEALQNVAKHAHASEATVRIERANGTVRLTIRDVGQGFQPGAGRGLGLVSMSERVRLVNGSISIRSAPGQGTTITVNIPV